MQELGLAPSCALVIASKMQWGNKWLLIIKYYRNRI